MIFATFLLRIVEGLQFARSKVRLRFKIIATAHPGVLFFVDLKHAIFQA
jgi:hypothetical protein